MRFKGMGRDRKYEIRNTEYGIETNVERPVQNIEWKYNVPGRDRCKMQETRDLSADRRVRLSSVDMKILPTEQDFHLACPAAAGI